MPKSVFNDKPPKDKARDQHPAELLVQQAEEKKPDPTPEPTKEDTVQLNIAIPESIHLAMKLKALQSRVTVREMYVEAARRLCNEVEK